LVTSMASNDWMVNPFCKDVTIDCGTYWKNRIGFNFITFLAETNVYIDGKFKEGHRAIPWILILGTLFVIVHVTRNSTNDVKSEFGSETQNAFGISIIPQIENYFNSQFPRYATSILLVIFTFTSTAGCFPLLMGAGEGESGTPVWLLGIGNGVPANTPSVSNESSSGGGGGGSASSGSTRITGMYFYHPDHLGSITMITDGNGNVLAGGERGGKSHITYKPYGEILRTDSYGPDITKFKYTGQEEDRESGLYYYKSRYYDSSLGRFISNDGMVFPEKTQGMNRQMYVEGNPIRFADSTGNALGFGFLDKLGDKMLGKIWDAVSKGIGRGIQRGLDRIENNVRKFPHNIKNRLFVRNERYSLLRQNRHAIESVIGIAASLSSRNPVFLVLTNKSIKRQLSEFFKYPRHSIENSDLAKSDLGKIITKNREDLNDASAFTGLTSIPNGGILFSYLAKLTGYTILIQVGIIVGIAGFLNFIYEKCVKPRSDTYCEVGGR